MLTGLSHRGLPHQEIIRTANERHGFESTYAALTTLFKHRGLTNPKGAKDKLNAIDTRNKSISLPPLSPTQASTRVCTLTEAPLSKLPIHMKNVVDNSPDNKTLPAFSRNVFASFGHGDRDCCYGGGYDRECFGYCQHHSGGDF